MEDIEDFIEKRYKHQLEWLNGKAKLYKLAYTLGSGAVIVLSAIIPVLIQVSDRTRCLASVFSIIVAIIGGLLSRFAPYRLWQQYRTTAETLVAEYWSYKAHIGEYKSVEDVDELFAEHVQAILKIEHVDWVKLHSEIQLSLKQKEGK